LDNRHDSDELLDESVPWVVKKLFPGSGETLARRSSDDDSGISEPSFDLFVAHLAYVAAKRLRTGVVEAVSLARHIPIVDGIRYGKAGIRETLRKPPRSGEEV
jgi:hypothetical protein